MALLNAHVPGSMLTPALCMQPSQARDMSQMCYCNMVEHYVAQGLGLLDSRATDSAHQLKVCLRPEQLHHQLAAWQQHSRPNQAVPV